VGVASLTSRHSCACHRNDGENLRSGASARPCKWTRGDRMNAVFARPACHDALERLKDKHLLKSLAYVGGRWVANSANRTFEVKDPASSVPVAWVAALDADETGKAVDAA